MKIIFTIISILIFILINITAQNKKELNALIYKLRTDSASIKVEIKDLNNSISNLKKRLIFKKSQLSKKTNENEVYNYNFFNI